MSWSLNRIGWASFGAAALVAIGAPTHAQSAPEKTAAAAQAAPVSPAAAAAKLSGTWKLNPEFSTDTESLSAADPAASAAGTSGGPGGGSGQHHGGGGGGGYPGGGMGGGYPGGGMGGGYPGGGMGGAGRGGAGARGVSTESEPVRQKKVLTDWLLNPPTQLTIAATAADVTLTDDQDTTTSFTIDGKSEKVDLLIAVVPCTTSWNGDVLTMAFDGGSTKLTATYGVSTTGNQLIATMTLTSSNSKERPRPPVKTVYDRVVSIH